MKNTVLAQAFKKALAANPGAQAANNDQLFDVPTYQSIRACAQDMDGIIRFIFSEGATEYKNPDVDYAVLIRLKIEGIMKYIIGLSEHKIRDLYSHFSHHSDVPDTQVIDIAQRIFENKKNPNAFFFHIFAPFGFGQKIFQLESIWRNPHKQFYVSNRDELALSRPSEGLLTGLRTPADASSVFKVLRSVPEKVSKATAGSDEMGKNPESKEQNSKVKFNSVRACAEALDELFRFLYNEGTTKYNDPDIDYAREIRLLIEGTLKYIIGLNAHKIKELYMQFAQTADVTETKIDDLVKTISEHKKNPDTVFSLVFAPFGFSNKIDILEKIWKAPLKKFFMVNRDEEAIKRPVSGVLSTLHPFEEESDERLKIKKVRKTTSDSVEGSLARKPHRRSFQASPDKKDSTRHPPLKDLGVRRIPEEEIPEAEEVANQGVEPTSEEREMFLNLLEEELLTTQALLFDKVIFLRDLVSYFHYEDALSELEAQEVKIKNEIEQYISVDDLEIKVASLNQEIEDIHYRRRQVSDFRRKISSLKDRITRLNARIKAMRTSGDLTKKDDLIAAIAKVSFEKNKIQSDIMDLTVQRVPTHQEFTDAISRSFGLDMRNFGAHGKQVNMQIIGKYFFENLNSSMGGISEDPATGLNLAMIIKMHEILIGTGPLPEELNFSIEEISSFFKYLKNLIIEKQKNEYDIRIERDLPIVRVTQNRMEALVPEDEEDEQNPWKERRIKEKIDLTSQIERLERRLRAYIEYHQELFEAKTRQRQRLILEVKDTELSTEEKARKTIEIQKLDEELESLPIMVGKPDEYEEFKKELATLIRRKRRIRIKVLGKRANNQLEDESEG